jgi:hypothetical protein
MQNVIKAGDLVMYRKLAAWMPPPDIKDGTTGVIIKRLSDLEYEVLIEGKIRIIIAPLLWVIDETG